MEAIAQRENIALLDFDYDKWVNLMMNFLPIMLKYYNLLFITVNIQYRQ